MTPTSKQQTRKFRWGIELRLRSNPEQRPVPEPDRLGLVRFGAENQGIRARRRVRGRAGRGYTDIARLGSGAGPGHLGNVGR